MSQFNFKKTAQLGLISGIIVLSVSAIGMVQTFDERDIITGVLTLGQLLLFSAPIISGYLAWNRQKEENVSAGIVVLRGTLVGFLSAVPVIGLIALTRVWPLGSPPRTPTWMTSASTGPLSTPMGIWISSPTG